MKFGALKAKATLVSSLSAFFFMATAARVRAADLPPVKAQKPPSKDEENRWTVWVEAGRFNTRGQSVNVGDPIPVGLPKWGAAGAVGFDVQAAFSPWHISGQIRLGKTKRKNSIFNRRGLANVNQQLTSTGTTTTTGGGTSHFTNNFLTPAKIAVIAHGTLQHQEKHKIIDFAIGRDVGIGANLAQLKFGIRYAEITANTTGSAQFTAPASITASGFPATTAVVHGAFGFTQRSRFYGIGPRVGIDGRFALPLPAAPSGAWALEYAGGVAPLVANRTLTVTTTGAAAGFGIFNVDNRSTAVVMSLDALGGLSYSFNKNFKVMAGYRFDGFWGALKTIDANGAIVNGDRFFYGPILRANLQF